MHPRIILLDTITAIDATAGGAIIVTGSHGGSSSTEFVLRNSAQPLLVLFNDAGIGKDHAGIFCLSALQELNIACACYSHESARIGDASDGYYNGLITCANDAAVNGGIEIGMAVKQACTIYADRAGRKHP